MQGDRGFSSHSQRASVYFLNYVQSEEVTQPRRDDSAVHAPQCDPRSCCRVTNGNAKIRAEFFKCKEVGSIMTFLFSCLAIQREAFLFPLSLRLAYN